MKTQVLGSGTYKVQDEHGNKIELEFPKIEKERTAFNLHGLKYMRDRYQILEDGTSLPVAWTMRLRQETGGRPLEPYELASMRKKYDVLPGDLVLLQPCEECNGAGFIGDPDDGTGEICPDCGGFGWQVSPLLVELTKALGWLQDPQRKVTETEIQKKNTAAILRKEAEKKKKAIAEEHARKLREAQQEKLRTIQSKTREAMAKEQAAIDKELQEALAALEKQD